MCRCFQEEPEYEEPPALPPRSEDILEPEAPPLPYRSPAVEEAEEDEGEYEVLTEATPPAPAPAGPWLP